MNGKKNESPTLMSTNENGNEKKNSRKKSIDDENIINYSSVDDNLFQRYVLCIIYVCM
jgi:hypothetical protein